jgi:Uma2 family endonuclease
MPPETYASTVSATQEQVEDLVLEILPAQGQWSEDAYLWLTDHTTRLIEFTDGYIEVLPMPTDAHQTIVLLLYELLVAFLRPLGGKVLVAPLRLKIRDGKYREPDVLLVRSAHDTRRQNRFWLGADLVIEVGSPDKPERDLVEKRGDYAEAQTPEYWIVNPQSETITVLYLEGPMYAEHGVFGRGATATSVMLEGFGVNVEAVFDAD